MKTFRRSFAGLVLAVAAIAGVAGCGNAPTRSPDVIDGVRGSLSQAGFRDVSVSQDRDKGIVTLSGRVASDGDKVQAESITKSIAGPQVVANQIAVIPPGAENEAKKINSDLDNGIESNLDAALIRNTLDPDVKYDVKNGVVTLHGEVNSQARRALAEKVAAAVPNVQQVVNELQVRNQKATSTP